MDHCQVILVLLMPEVKLVAVLVQSLNEFLWRDLHVCGKFDFQI